MAKTKIWINIWCLFIIPISLLTLNGDLLSILMIGEGIMRTMYTVDTIKLMGIVNVILAIITMATISGYRILLAGLIIVLVLSMLTVMPYIVGAYLLLACVLIILVRKYEDEKK